MTNKQTVAVFDMDRTITRSGTFSPFLLHFCRTNKAKYVHVPYILGSMIAYKAGFFSRKALKERMLDSFLAGLPRRDVSAYARSFLQHLLDNDGFCPGALKAIAGHKDAGHTLVIATASMDFYVEVIAAHLGFDHIVATGSCWTPEDTLTREIIGENCYGSGKLDMVKKALPDIDMARENYHVIAYSDHHTDMPLFNWADVAVAVNPNSKLTKLAGQKGFQLDNWH